MTAAADIMLFLCGDVMTGRGIDQILPHPGRPQLFEPYMHSALGYVQLAEAQTGPLPRHADFAYVWGDALAELARLLPHARIVNLETAVTDADEPWPGKGIHYRMHPANVACLSAAAIDCCVLANNHVLDWGYAGLTQTLETLRLAGIRTAGAGLDATQAAAPAVISTPDGRVLVFAFGVASAGVPVEWSASERRAGVCFLSELSHRAAEAIAAQVAAVKRPRDIVIASIHWGGNWGYGVSRAERAFAHRLIDAAGIDLVHGHSSHHPKGVEVYRDKLVLYGCGDFLNDYEGISGYGSFRGDLTLMYLPTLDVATGRLRAMTMTPLQIRRFRLHRAEEAEVQWLQERLDLESRRFGAGVSRDTDGRLQLRWSAA